MRCRFQKLRKKAGVTPMDPVEFFYQLLPPASTSASAAAGAAAKASGSAAAAGAGGEGDPLAALVAEQAAYFKVCLDSKRQLTPRGIEPLHIHPWSVWHQPARQGLPASAEEWFAPSRGTLLAYTQGLSL